MLTKCLILLAKIVMAFLVMPVGAVYQFSRTGSVPKWEYADRPLVSLSVQDAG